MIFLSITITTRCNCENEIKNSSFLHFFVSLPCLFQMAEHIVMRGLPKSIVLYYTVVPVADPGFSPEGRQLPKWGVLTYFFGRKLHEIERIWTPRGGTRPWRPLRSATEYDTLWAYSLYLQDLSRSGSKAKDTWNVDGSFLL